MMALDAELEGLKKSRNPLIKILERSKGLDPEAQGRVEEDEEEEEMVIRRRKGNMVVEEEDKPAPEVNKASVFVEAFNTHVPFSLLPFMFEEEPRSQELEDVPMIEEMEITPGTTESVLVETGHIFEGADLEVEGEQQVEQGDDNNDDDDDEGDGEEAEGQPRSPESTTSTIPPRAWKKKLIQSRTGVHGRCKPTSLKMEPSDEIRFRGNERAKATYLNLEGRLVILDRGFADEHLTHNLITRVIEQYKREVFSRHNFEPSSWNY